MVKFSNVKAPFSIFLARIQLKISKWRSETVLSWNHGVIFFVQCQEDSEFMHSQEEVVQLNRQISDLSQVRLLQLISVVAEHGRCWDLLNLLTGEWAAASVSAESSDRHRHSSLRPGQAEEYVCRPESPTPTVRCCRQAHIRTNSEPCDTTCVSSQRKRWFEADGVGIPDIFQSDPASPVSLVFTWCWCCVWT